MDPAFFRRPDSAQVNAQALKDNMNDLFIPHRIRLILAQAVLALLRLFFLDTN
jgi:hypothetical protein